MQHQTQLPRLEHIEKPSMSMHAFEKDDMQSQRMRQIQDSPLFPQHMNRGKLPIQKKVMTKEKFLSTSMRVDLPNFLNQVHSGK
mmetsp:Transcript_44658/g.65685  ORF Transcript_44658/g.65685 Transcript_44658/m.65685 type:complete len:84 (-) Transcript_44658:2594-2845(-)